MRLPLRVAFVLLLGLALTEACGEKRDDDAAGSDASGARLEHVHGLGVDPADGTLYVGTHHGVFRVGEGAIEGPVGDLEQDFMGFTVAGPGHFLASGHPAPGQDAPSALGVLESTDSGASWATRSLAGDADCHALTYGHGTAYCVNSVSGELLASSDLESWEARSEAPVFDVAVSPDSADVLLATSERGPLRSGDGGRSFEPLGDAPLLVFVEWVGDGTVVGVDPHGTVMIRSGGAPRFAPSGALPDMPEAFHAASATELYASVGGELWVSDDGGRGFHPMVP